VMRTSFEGWRRDLRVLCRSKLAVTGGIVLLVIGLIAVLANVLAPYDPYEPHYDNVLEAPCKQFLFGTDIMGRDILSRVIHGARLSLVVGLCTVGIALAGGVPAGIISGFFGGWVDTSIMRAMDIILTFPPLLLALLLLAVAGPGESNAIVAVGLVYVPKVARLVRSKALSERNQTYVEAARAIGRSSLGVAFIHVLRNCTSIIIVQATVTIPETILIAAALNFLGMGTSPSTPVWGLMISRGRDFMGVAPWVVLFPAAALSLLVLGLNFFGDGLRDVSDVRTTL